jgi:hypothetical protein
MCGERLVQVRARLKSFKFKEALSALSLNPSRNARSSVNTAGRNRQEVRQKLGGRDQAALQKVSAEQKDSRRKQSLAMS